MSGRTAVQTQLVLTFNLMFVFFWSRQLHLSEGFALLCLLVGGGKTGEALGRGRGRGAGIGFSESSSVQVSI